MSTYQISCTVGTSDPTAPLGLEVWVDDLQLCDIPHVVDEMPLSFVVEETEGPHELRFVMKNKTTEHTVIDSEGAIVKDAGITIGDVAFDDVMTNYILTNNAQYTHDFNGTQKPTIDRFYGYMGCNGTVSLAFTAPVYLWLLENM